MIFTFMLAFFVSSWSTLAFARECGAVFEDARVQINVQNQILKTGFEEFVPTLERMAAAVGVPPVKIRIGNEGQWAAYDHRTDSIAAPAQYLKGGRYTNHPKYGHAILTHEYTHGILEAYLKKHSTDWNSSSKAIEVAKAASEKAMDDFFAATRRLGSEKDPVKNAEIKRQADEASQRMIATGEQLRLSIYERSFFKAYHELTADLIPVLLFKDLHIMENSIRAKEMSHENAAEWRSFDNHFGAAKLALWKRTVEKSGTQISGYDPYYFFAPARAMIGASLRGRSFSESDILAKLPKIFPVVGRHFEEHIARRPEKAKLDLVYLNETLAREISAILDAP